jgi:hypothetical protein
MFSTSILLVGRGERTARHAQSSATARFPTCVCGFLPTSRLMVPWTSEASSACSSRPARGSSRNSRRFVLSPTIRSQTGFARGVGRWRHDYASCNVRGRRLHDARCSARAPSARFHALPCQLDRSRFSASPQTGSRLYWTWGLGRGGLMAPRRFSNQRRKRRGGSSSCRKRCVCRDVSLHQLRLRARCSVREFLAPVPELRRPVFLGSGHGRRRTRGSAELREGLDLRPPRSGLRRTYAPGYSLRLD